MTEIRITSLAEENRLEELIALNTSVHNIGDGPFCRRMLLHSPESNNPAYHRFLLKDGKIVAAASLIPHTMTWHESEIKAGEIGLVGTIQEHRNQGYCSALMESWIDTMRSDGIPFSFLWGIPDFYQRYHYYYAFPHTRTPYVSLPVSCIAGWTASGTIRQAEIGDRWWIQKLYRAYNQGLTGTIARSPELWDWIFRLTTDDNQGKWWVLEDPMGGYAFIADKPPKVFEIATASENSLRNLVLGIAKTYPEIDNLDFCHHPEMLVGRWLYHWGARCASTEDIWQGTWGGMVRIMDLVTLLSAMTQKMQERLANSRCWNHTGRLSIESEVGSASVGVSKGAVSIEPYDGKDALQIPAGILTPLLTGYRGFERYRSEFAGINSNAAELLTVLFPRDRVFVYPLLYADEYFQLIQ